MTKYLITSVSCTDEHLELPSSLTLELTPELLERIQRLRAAARAIRDSGEVVWGIEVSVWSIDSSPLSVYKSAVSSSVDADGDDDTFPPVRSTPLTYRVAPGVTGTYPDSALVDAADLPESDDNFWEIPENRIDSRGIRVDENSVSLWAYPKYAEGVMRSEHIDIDALLAALKTEVPA